MKRKSIITGINGPIVRAMGEELSHAGMLEVVNVGEEELLGEIIHLDGETVIIQVFEDTGGLKAGDPVIRTFEPLSLHLGPGLLGNIYDGIQRPLRSIYENGGDVMKRGDKTFALPQKKKWDFNPLVKKGDIVKEGCRLGEIKETKLINHFIMVPPGVNGIIKDIAVKGKYYISDIWALIESEDDNRVEVKFYQKWPVRIGRPYQLKMDITEPLITGQRIIDSFYPIARGGSAALPGGFGTGKTMTQQALSKWSDADIVIYIGCGERGNEMTDVLMEFSRLIDLNSGEPLMERTLLIANTSNMPVAAREASIYTGITIAEYYRDMGYSVALLADSTSRWAEAL
ncbi:MAG: V-type ATP synthase subunit A, partial [Actinomycetia bacterium]|nr:V-type ATP synthase subunit A [Actinomycetes bacterium]